jgi:hypothetical protein
MPRLRAEAPIENFVRANAFDYRSEQRALEARIRLMVQSISETADSLPAEPFDYPARPETASVARFQWPRLNWGLIGALLFTLLAWWIILSSAAPALRAVFGGVAG